MAPNLKAKKGQKTTSKKQLKARVVGKLSSWPKRTGLPKSGEMDLKGVITEHNVELEVMPPLNLLVKPVPTKDIGRCTSRLLTKPIRVKYLGSIRCHGGTTQSSPALTYRNSMDCANQIKYNPDFREAVKKSGKHLSSYRVVSPTFGEWLCGLPRGWTSTEKMERASTPQGRRYKVFDMFSGCAGLGLSLHSAFKTVAYCEWNETCQAVLKARIADGHLDKAPVYGDIKKVKVEDIPDFDLAAFGFPCQDISMGGAQEGFEGERSVLFRRAMTFVRAKKPKWILIENVAALISGNMSEVWQEVFESIRKCGYSVKWTTVCAKHAGSPTTRTRVFLLATHKSTSEPFPISQIREEVNFKKFNTPKPAITQWMLPDSKVTAAERSRLHMLGNIVIPPQAKLALDVICGLEQSSS
eukprot:TRINITY_DN102390_c0_g1_i1.p1 TRINITY_DN102390_c0_g1~~TRINITY_DN102390_c0_g1_i1.p1  ORF type:complete len:437 (+),score=49.21 TRINITY_DN102390_c0_g1_i1:78-1313(+)